MYKAETKVTAPTKLPKNTVPMFWINCKTEIFAPSNIAAGIANMFATKCWNPIATNVIIGNHTPNILLPTSLAAKFNHTAIPTNQLHPTAEKNTCQNVKYTFDSPAEIVLAAIAPPVKPVK